LQGAFSALAEALPAFSPGVCPAEASEYLAYYGLDMTAEFPVVRHGLGTVRSGDHRLAVQCWEQAGAAETLMLVHGYFDHVGLYGHLVRFGLARGANVVAFDLPGHGLSSGPQAEIRDFAEYRQAIVNVLSCVAFLPGTRDVIAQSTGGAAVMDYLQCETNDFDRIVLLAPLVRPAHWWRIKLGYLLLHRFVASVPRGFADSSQDPEFLDFVRQDPLQSPIVPVCWVGALRRWLAAYLAAPTLPGAPADPAGGRR
jgi:lysophospholipase